MVCVFGGVGREQILLVGKVQNRDANRLHPVSKVQCVDM